MHESVPGLDSEQWGHVTIVGVMGSLVLWLIRCNENDKKIFREEKAELLSELKAERAASAEFRSTTIKQNTDAINSAKSAIEVQNKYYETITSHIIGDAVDGIRKENIRQLTERVVLSNHTKKEH